MGGKDKTQATCDRSDVATAPTRFRDAGEDWLSQNRVRRIFTSGEPKRAPSRTPGPGRMYPMDTMAANIVAAETKSPPVGRQANPATLLDTRFSAFYAMVHRYLLHRLFDRELAEELTAATFYKAIGAAGRGADGRGRDATMASENRHQSGQPALPQDPPAKVPAACGGRPVAAKPGTRHHFRRLTERIPAAPGCVPSCKPCR